MDVQATAGLIAIGAAQDDLRPRFVEFAANFFAKLAQGEKPPKPDPFIAELVADSCAKTVGAEVPLPLQAAGPRTYTKRQAVSVAPNEIPPVDIRPEAGALLEALGMKHVHFASRLVFSAFLQHPDTWLKTATVAKATGKTPTSVISIIKRLKAAAGIEKRGERSSSEWKLAEMPPRV